MAKKAKKKTTKKKKKAAARAGSDICSRKPDHSVDVPPGKRFDFYVDVPDEDVQPLMRCHEGKFYASNVVPSRTRPVATVVLMYRRGNG